MLGKTMFFQDQAYCIYRNGMLEETCMCRICDYLPVLRLERIANAGHLQI